jgi:hypothetical protein
MAAAGEPNYTLDLQLLGTDGDHNTAGLKATAMRLVNAVPAVVAAEPGLVTALDLPLVTGAAWWSDPVEKLDYLLWDRADDVSAVLGCEGVRSVTLQVADPELPQTLLLGQGARLAALASVRLSSGWHEVHTPHSAQLHPLRWSYVRDTVVRTLTPGSPPVRAIVVERFAVSDYADPKRLFGSKQALEQNMTDLPGYADLADISSCPMRQVALA